MADSIGRPAARPPVGGRWAPVTAAQLEAYEAVEGVPARRLARSMLMAQRPGGRLKAWEREQLDNYLESWGMADVDADEVATVQMSKAEAQRVIGSRRGPYSASAVFAQLCACGFAAKVADGVKGHPSLYLLGPFEAE